MWWPSNNSWIRGCLGVGPSGQLNKNLPDSTHVFDAGNVALGSWLLIDFCLLLCLMNADSMVATWKLIVLGYCDVFMLFLKIVNFMVYNLNFSTTFNLELVGACALLLACKLNTCAEFCSSQSVNHIDWQEHFWMCCNISDMYGFCFLTHLIYLYIWFGLSLIWTSSSILESGESLSRTASQVYYLHYWLQ